VIAAFEDVPEPGHDEGHRSVVPARIEAHQARIAVKLERARGAFGRKEAQRRGDVLAEPVDTHADGELGTVGVDRVFEQDIEQLLIPVEV